MCPGNSNVNLNTMIIIIIIIGTLVRVHVKLLYHLADIFLEKREVSHKGCKENQNTKFMFNHFFPRKS